MLRSLTKRLSRVLRNFAGKKKIDSAAFDLILSDIRNSLIDVDVSFEVADYLTGLIKESSQKKGLFLDSDPANLLTQIIKEELIKLISEEEKHHSFSPKGNPAIIMLVGANGAGKTTSCAKIAYHLKHKHQKSVLLVSLDNVRPAAQEQLRVMSGLALAEYFESKKSTIEEICLDSLSFARQKGCEVIIYDTSGCSHLDLDAMNSLQKIKSVIAPREVLLVADSLTGQDAAKSAKCFADIVGISGVILTKMDSDSKGAAALSIKYVTKKSIKFIGVGEDVKDFEPFDPKSIASRIMDMGDVETLKKKLEEVLDTKTKDQELEKIQSGKFTLEDYESHIVKLSKIGGISKIIGFLPNASKLLDNPVFDKGCIDKNLLIQQSIIRSMTPKERRIPQLITHSRKKRIAIGSGRTILEVEALLKQFQQMSNLIKMGPKSILAATKKFF